MKNLKQIDCVALTNLECQQIEGGSDTPKSSFWYTLGYTSVELINGLIEFSSAGSRNAGICVK